MNKAIILLSGGLDSVTLAHFVKKELNKDVKALFFDYGQLQLEQELKHTAQCCEELKIPLEVVKLDLITTDQEYIPARNLIFLSHAIALAEKEHIREAEGQVVGEVEGVPNKIHRIIVKAEQEKQQQSQDGPTASGETIDADFEVVNDKK